MPQFSSSRIGRELTGLWRAQSTAPPLVAMIVAMVLVTIWGAVALDHGRVPTFAGWQLVHAILYGGAVWWVMRRPPRPRDLALIIAGAIVLRGLAMTAPGILSTDSLRYVWDGRIQWAGFNPYLHVPADPLLEHLRDAAIYPGINQKETAVTIYPPLAEMLFALAVRLYDGVDGVKLVMAAAEAACMWGLVAWLGRAGAARERVVIYAWHPLPIWEFSSQGHLDAAATALAILALVATQRGRQGMAGAIFAAAALVKYYPALLMAAAWRRWHAAMPVAFAMVVVALYLPYWIGAGPKVIGFLGNHLDNEGYRAGFGFHVIWLLRDFAIADVPGRLYIAVGALVLAGMASWCLFTRDADDVTRPARLLALATAFAWLTSPHYTWYFGWLVALSVLHPRAPVIGFTLAALALGVPGDPVTVTPSAVYLIAFGSLPVLLVLEALWRGWQSRTSLGTSLGGKPGDDNRARAGAQ